MVNAWSLLYEEIDGTMDETYPIKEDKMSESLGEDVYEDLLDRQKDDGYEHSSAYFDYTRNDPDRPNPFPKSEHYDDFENPLPFQEDYVSAEFPTGNVYAADTVSIDWGYGGEDYITFDSGDSYVGTGNTASMEYGFPSKPQPNLKYKSQKYGEDKGIADLKDYVSSTYQGHYTNDSSDVQTLDLIHSVGDAESFCRSNALKYLSRYDKKGQAKRDILKAMHYCLLLYYFSGQTNNETPTRGYETF